MKDEDYQDLLSRAIALMDSRESDLPPASLPGNITVRGKILSYEGRESRQSTEGGTIRVYPGDLQLGLNQVGIVPFGVYREDNTDYFMAPNIGDRSLFEDNPPKLARNTSGAAVYIESEFEIYHRGAESTGVGDNPYRARLIACNIVDRPLGAPYPIQKATLMVSVPSGTWSLGSSTAKAYRLLGVYDSNGNVYNQTYIGGEPWYYQNTTLEDDRIIPPQRSAALIAPFKYEVTFDY